MEIDPNETFAHLYPQGLKGEDIPLEARIVTVCDVFVALTSERPYKKAWPVEDAIEEMQKLRGTLFDPQLFDVFMKLLPEMITISQNFADT